MKEYYPFLANKVKDFCLTTGTELTKQKYNDKSRLCLAYSIEPGYISFIADNFYITVKQDNLNTIRTNMGENTLLLYGLPTREEEIPTIVLLPTPSFFKSLGIVKSIDFLLNWRGQSAVGNKIVVRYKLIGEKECTQSPSATGK